MLLTCFCNLNDICLYFSAWSLFTIINYQSISFYLCIWISSLTSWALLLIHVFLSCTILYCYITCYVYYAIKYSYSFSYIVYACWLPGKISRLLQYNSTVSSSKTIPYGDICWINCFIKILFSHFCKIISYIIYVKISKCILMLLVVESPPLFSSRFLFFISAPSY